MQKIESRIERLIPETHPEQHGPIGIIHAHYRILRHIDELVARLAL